MVQITKGAIYMRSKDPELMKKIIEFTDEYYQSNNKFPSKQMIADAVGFDKSVIVRYLAEMRDKGMIEYDGYSIITDKIKKHCNNNKAVVLDNSVSCGPMLLEEERVLEYISLPESVFGKGEMFIIRANGDSMIDAGIDDGDWVVIKRQFTAKEGDIIIAISDGLCNLKYLYFDKEEGCAILRFANKEKNYPDIKVKNLEVQGVAHKIIKDAVF